MFISLAGRTESDYGLDAEQLADLPAAARFPCPQRRTLGRARTRKCHDQTAVQFAAERLRPAAELFGLLATNTTGAPANATAWIPYLENPTTCGVPLTATASIEYYTARLSTRNVRWPARPAASSSPSTRASRPSRPPTQADSAIRRRRRSQGPAGRRARRRRRRRRSGPRRRRCRPGSRSTRTPPTARSPAPTPTARSAPERGATVRSSRRSGRSTLDSSALPAPIPGAIYLGEPKPGDRYRCPHRRRLRHPHQARRARCEPDPQTGQLTVAFEDLPAGAADRVRHALLRLRARPARDADPVRHLPGGKRIRPLGQRAADAALDAVLQSTSGPGGSACPDGPRPFSPSFQAGSANNTRRRALARSA